MTSGYERDELQVMPYVILVDQMCGKGMWRLVKAVFRHLVMSLGNQGWLHFTILSGVPMLKNSGAHRT